VKSFGSNDFYCIFVISERDKQAAQSRQRYINRLIGANKARYYSRM